MGSTGWGHQSITALGALGLNTQTWGGVRDPSAQEENSCPPHHPTFLTPHPSPPPSKGS